MADCSFAPQHFLNFLPLPQVQGSLRPILGLSRRIGVIGAYPRKLFFDLLTFSALSTGSLFLKHDIQPISRATSSISTPRLRVSSMAPSFPRAKARSILRQLMLPG